MSTNRKYHVGVLSLLICLAIVWGFGCRKTGKTPEMDMRWANGECSRLVWVDAMGRTEVQDALIIDRVRQVLLSVTHIGVEQPRKRLAIGDLHFITSNKEHVVAFYTENVIETGGYIYKVTTDATPKLKLIIASPPSTNSLPINNSK